MIHHYLHESRAVAVRDRGRDADPERDTSSFGVVFRAIESETESWQRSCRSLYDLGNWNVRELVTPEGRFVKPRILLRVDVTSKGNLILEWYPHPDAPHHFLRWSNDWQPTQEPPNRILMIRGFSDLWPDGEFYALAERRLIEAAHALLEQVIESLQLTFDAQLLTHLYLEYDGERRHRDTKLRKWRIREVAEVRREETAAANQRWLDSTFLKLQTTAPELLKHYTSAGGNMTKAVRELRAAGVNVGAQALRSILVRLYEDFPELYRAHSNVLPPGISPPPNNVVTMRRND